MSLEEKDAQKHDYEHLSLEALRKLFFRRVISYRGEYADLGIGTSDGKLGVPGAVFLSQAGWMTTEYGDEDGWFHCSQRDFERVTGLSDEAQKNVRKSLVKRGVWEEELRGEDLDVRAAVTYRSGGKMFYRIKQNELRLALIGVIYNSPRFKPDTSDDVAAAREKRNQAAKDKRIKDREARQALDAAQKRVSENPGYISQPENELKTSPIGDETCIRDFGIHVHEGAANTHPDLPQTPPIRQQHEINQEQDNKQSASQNTNAESFAPPSDVVNFLKAIDVVVGSDSDEDVFALEQRDREIFNELVASGARDSEARGLIDQHGLEACDTALNTPGMVKKLLKSLQPAAQSAAAPPHPALPAPKRAAPSQTTPPPAVAPQNARSGDRSGWSAADLEAVTAGRLSQLGVKPNPLRRSLAKYGVEYAASVLNGWETGHLKGESSAAVLTAMLNDGSYRPRAPRANAAAAASVAQSEVWRDDDALDMDAIKREDAELDAEWLHLSQATCDIIEMAALQEAGVFGETFTDPQAYRMIATRRTLQRANRAGKLQETVAAMRAAREARHAAETPEAETGT